MCILRIVFKKYNRVKVYADDEKVNFKFLCPRFLWLRQSMFVVMPFVVVCFLFFLIVFKFYGSVICANSNTFIVFIFLPLLWNKQDLAGILMISHMHYDFKRTYFSLCHHQRQYHSREVLICFVLFNSPLFSPSSLPFFSYLVNLFSCY